MHCIAPDAHWLRPHLYHCCYCSYCIIVHAGDTGTASASYASLPASSSQRTSAAHDRAFGSAPGWDASLQPSAQKPQKKKLKGLSSAGTPGKVHIGPLSAADRTAQQAEEERQKQQSAPKFIKAKSFEGQKAGYAFKKGPKGLGYYLDGDTGRFVAKPSSLYRQTLLCQNMRSKRKCRMMWMIATQTCSLRKVCSFEIKSPFSNHLQ